MDEMDCIYMPAFVYPFSSAEWPHPRTTDHQAIGQGASVLHEMPRNSSLGPSRGGLSIPKAVDGIVLVYWGCLSLACISIFFHPLLISNLLLFYEPKKVTWPSPRVTVWRKKTPRFERTHDKVTWQVSYIR